MNLIRSALPSAGTGLSEIAVRASRQTLAKRLWRAAADDGTDFGFELEAPLSHGDAVWASPTTNYVIRQQPEPVLEIPLDVSPDAAAVIGWAVGNLHFAIEAQSTRLLAPDDSGLRQSLDRLGVHYHEAVEVFQPHRLAVKLVGHGHDHGHSHG